MRLYIIRHGETDYNRNRIMQGYLEVPLNDSGIAQATRVALRLKACAIDRIVCSDIRRAVMTGCIVASHTGAPMTYDPALRERDVGKLTGLSYDNDLRFFTDEAYVPPGGEGMGIFRARVRRAFETLVAVRRGEDERVAVVTHGLVCSTFADEFVGPDQGAGAGTPNSSVTIVDYSDGIWTPVRIGCVAHLTDPGHSPVLGNSRTEPGA